MDYNRICNDMTEVARECGKIMREAENDSIAVTAKSSIRDLVTQYDVKVQKTAVSGLSEKYPEAVFIGEEGEHELPQEKSSSDSVYFVIDPIDGTSNFIHDYHHSCISIACVHNGAPVAAVVYDPYMDEMFHAVKGEGAFVNDVRMKMPEHSLAQSLVSFGTCPYNAEFMDKSLDAVKSLYGRCLDLRRSGSAALDLSYVAAGRTGMFFEYILSTWDYAAGALLVTEAGGICTRMDGTLPIFDRAAKCSIIAGRKELVKESGLCADPAE